MLIAEEKVLRPKDGAKGDSDSWPEFGLTKTKVISQKTGDLGFLDKVDDDQIRLVRDKQNYQKKPIVINDVESYAHAQYDDGTFGFWAEGKAGWFEVKNPVKVYEETFEDMIEATDMFYFLVDKYKNAITHMPHANAKALERYAVAQFKSFLKRPKCRREDASDVVEGFYQHREFFITSMLEGQENLPWLDSQILRHLKHKFRDEYRAIEAKVALAVDKDDIERQTEEEARVAKVDGDPKSDEETDGDNHMLSVHVTRKRKSVLRPAGGKSSKKAAGRRQSFRCDNEEDDSSQNSHSVESPSSTNGICTRADEDKAPDVALSPAVPSLSGDSALSDLPLRRTTVKITQHAMPSYKSQGPCDTWVCQFDGCNYKVYDATKPESREIIKSHFGTHPEQAQEKLDLIYKESRPYLPVNNLIQRIQAISAAHRDASAAPTLPTPIRRRF
ncbi:MAG: hypothetical protein FRX48_07734 [Lasallia pustulata]|uniref:RFTS domain-containing protein n=1 Tax=Lasallia pustulata TaxID=136370 RepID=A0A5M8PJ71_9LECA|nr:MAG: hypothetical protein FRX48_07734 [Lasallia pustulata]